MRMARIWLMPMHPLLEVPMDLRALGLTLLACTLALAQRTATPPGPRGGGPSGGSGGGDRAIGGEISNSPFMAGGGAGPRNFGHLGREGVAMPPRPSNGPQVAKISYFKTTGPGARRVIFPPPFPRCSVLPDAAYWRSRDLMAEIQWLSRAGFLPVTPVDASAETVVDHTWMPSGWKAYGFAVAPGGRLQVEVQHGKLGWFRLMAVDKWGKPGPGMLEAAIAHRPTLVTVSNPDRKPRAVYIIVDDPAWWSSKEDPYTLSIRRDWDPATVDLSSVTMVTGLWGSSPSISAEFRGPSRTGPAHFPN